jgi:hypothetical protein
MQRFMVVSRHLQPLTLPLVTAHHYDNVVISTDTWYLATAHSDRLMAAVNDVLHDAANSCLRARMVCAAREFC